MSFGFSVSDFIVVGRLIAKVVDALHGIQSEYQELIRELESLERALTQVDKLKGHGDQTAAIDRIKCIALTCRYPLEEFLNKIQKYDKSLGLGKSVGKVKHAGKKIQYAFSAKKEADALRTYLNMHTGIINMLLTEHGLELLVVASDQRSKNQEELRNRIEGSSRVLGEVRGNVEAQSLAIKGNGSLLQNLLSTISDQIVAPLRSLSQTVTKICISTQQIYTIVLELRDSAREIDTRFTYFQDPVKVEDALARVFHFPAEFSIEALSAEIKVRFKEGAGKEEVMAGSFEIFNSQNPDQVLAISDRNGLVSGMSIKMKIILEIDLTIQGPMPSEAFVKEVGGERIYWLMDGHDSQQCSECNAQSDGLCKKREREFSRESQSQIGCSLQTVAHRTRGWRKQDLKKPKLLLSTRIKYWVSRVGYSTPSRAVGFRKDLPQRFTEPSFSHYADGEMNIHSRTECHVITCKE